MFLFYAENSTLFSIFLPSITILLFILPNLTVFSLIFKGSGSFLGISNPVISKSWEISNFLKSGISKIKFLTKLSLYVFNLQKSTFGCSPDLVLGLADFGDLGYSYDLVELLSCGLEQGLNHQELRKHSVIKAMIERDMGVYTKKYGRSKFTAVDAMVDDYLGRHKIALHKAKIISPAIAPVSLQF